MRSTKVTIAGTLALLVVPPPAVTSQPLPTCFGATATIVGTEGPDRLMGTPFDDVIVGGGSGDAIRGGGGDDRICGGAGNDAPLSGQDGSDRVSGGEGSDIVRGRRGDDVLHGDEGFDLLIPDAGEDSANGGKAFDAVEYFSSPRGVRVDLPRDVATGNGRDRLVSIEDPSGSQHDDVLLGDAGSNSVQGGDGDDVIRTGRGKDFVSPGPGRDEISAGPGYDFLTYFIAEGVVVDLDRGTTTGEGTDRFTSIEYVQGSRGRDRLLGDHADNYLDGIDSADVIVGRGGDDRLIGRDGNDTLRGGPGRDDLAGGPGTDRCDGEVERGCESPQAAVGTVWKLSWSSVASITMWSPSVKVPSSSFSARTFSISRWISRFKGRAPYAGSYP